MRADICVGLAWGDEAKGKIVAQLAKSGNYNYVCRWAGGSNAGHTIYVKGVKYITHLIPSGIFFGVKSIIGPDCVINATKFTEEIEYLRGHGFDTTLIKVSPKCHVVTDAHIAEDQATQNKLGTTAQGIGMCYRDKAARTGIRAETVEFFREYLWDEKLDGNIICEGAQGFWLDTNQGNYPFVTSSTTLPYGACSLGFPPKAIRTIYGAVKIYDTRSGLDPDFPESLLDDPDLLEIAKIGEEYGNTTGRPRTVNWLNVDKLIEAISVSGTDILVISKLDILTKINKFKLIYGGITVSFRSIGEMKFKLEMIIMTNCRGINNIIYSNDPYNVDGL
jgi:adenylosuccinate synthase